MKKFPGTAFIILIVLQIFFPAGLLHAKQAPPEKLIKIFEHLSKLEEKFKSEEWDGAIKETDTVSSTFKEVLPQLKKTFKVDILTTFNQRLRNLRQTIQRKNVEATQDNYIALQELLLTIMNNYEYKVPPVFVIINKYLQEAETALKKKDFKRVVSEMDEIGDFFYGANYLLKEKGVRHKDIEEFSATIRAVWAAGRAKDAKTVQHGITKLKKMSSGFLKLFETAR